MSKGTPLRSVRVPDDLWARALARADQEGTSVTAVLVAALNDFTAGPPLLREASAVVQRSSRAAATHTER